ncbi:MAG: KOW domain-containing RNA-binding protein [Syntrophaceticus schinkii]|nr:KOW domain-containing RNA-binding protein [Syntrophaceticus schinkii]MDD4675100.1 KOW domain-containing RNA-binding protein [Syntrophaceticus schinkii]
MTLIDEQIKLGQLVCSKRGRDRGKYYLVLEIRDNTFVYLVDGEKRRMDNPKQKNIKHLKLYPAVAGDLVQQWETGQNPGNSEVRRVIARFKQHFLLDQESETRG